ncbi:MAG: T9SS type A sorting domain-containing protein [bacterium]
MKFLYSIFGFLLLFTSSLLSEDLDVSSLPKLLGTSNAGTEFYFTFLPSIKLADVGYYHSLYISSNVKTKVTITVERMNFENIYYTNPNEIMEINLDPAITSCYRRNERDKPESWEVWSEAGVHVVADAPIICYGLTDNHSSETSDGFIALPVESLGKEYIISSYLDHGLDSFDYYTSYSGITAGFDSTFVRFTLGGNDCSKTTGGLSSGEYHDYLLQRGDVLLIASIGTGADLSGSKVDASKPVSVVSGNLCANVPSDCYICNLLEEMEIPTYAWGKTYHVTPIWWRKKNSIIKIYAKEPMTSIYRDGEFLGIIRTAGGIEGIGYLHLRADDGEPRPIVISGDKPISVTQYNTGHNEDSVESKPFQMTLVPVENYVNEITFHTPEIGGWASHEYHYYNICYQADVNDSIPDDFEIAMTVGGEFTWEKLKKLTPDPGKPFSKVDDNSNYFCKTILLVAGVYKMKANKPFQLYSYGNSEYSYGMPASVSLDSVKYSDVPQKEEIDFIDIFPNPVSDNLIINSEVKINKIKIYDILGIERLCPNLINDFRIVINTSGLNDGIYFIKIEYGEKYIIRKFIIMR